MQFHNYFGQTGHFAHISCQNKTGKNITTGDFSNVMVHNHPTFYSILDFSSTEGITNHMHISESVSNHISLFSSTRYSN